MVRRSHKRRKRFSCGHLGFGQFCHRCLRGLVPSPGSQLSKKEKIYPKAKGRRVWKPAASPAAKCQWQASFTHDPIDLSHLPKPIVLKARRILASLSQGTAPSQLQGKRFNFDRTLLRIPITYRYRLLCRWEIDRIVPLQVLTHEAYNAIARNKKYPKRS